MVRRLTRLGGPPVSADGVRGGWGGRTARLPWRFRPRPRGGPFEGDRGDQVRRPDTPAPVPQPGPRGVPLGSRRGGPRGGHRRRGGRRGSPLVVELRAVGGEGRILGRPAVEAGLNACWWSGVPVGGRWTNPEPSTASEETAHGVQAPAGDVLAKRPDWQAWRLVW